ncbi:hypothetical protein SU69_06655 [Thermosipho melanesiensis]|uniref:Epoxyqueuosine reductase QueH n=2 Tax=Thermosipho melanesiensis TaxID=46541 RepID=A6LML2_THEM4|nr:epoxyqueuosine reductase QueH [Thermosipho melanesiensis]ABR31163.1 protein of unknown function DUF208 [Thermosipho melanesiensis BI429]APT74253.1 hypothetical protein BW47_06980 [Thermosipho melanesiensis]OOC36192.1 hypothetical protein SU68_06725 [Thermosipho melanesiensis]OOC37010.1 hypothetical protein SU69_06655 [Thermosipho melanesiensis]OOC37762.1 hypothetical protein SU70_06665 [Thermosipho melanesiensis]
MLLHVCCAPDLVAAYFHLKDKIKYIYFYNPNIHPKGEYIKRLNEVKKLAKLWNLKMIESKYNPDEFFQYVKGLENLGENSARCDKCIYLRLLNTANTAKKHNFTSFATTLTGSRKKILEKINNIGKIVGEEEKVKYVETHFRKGIESHLAARFIKENKIYRQNYCGCIFSKIENEEKIKKLKEKAKEKLKEMGLEYLQPFPETFKITKSSPKEIIENLKEVLKLTRPKLLYIDTYVMKKFNLKEGWNRLGNYNQKIKLIKESL